MKPDPEQTTDRTEPADRATDGAAPTDQATDKTEPANQATDGAAPEPGQGGEQSRRPRHRVPFAHAVRRISPRQAAVGATRAIGRWSRGPGGRLVLPALLLFSLVAASGAAGAILVPAAADHVRAGGGASPTPTAPAGPGNADFPIPPTALPPGATPPPFTQPTPVAVGRPADALAGWAQQAGGKVDVPAVAMQAYGYAELVLAQTTPSCHLTWTTLAAIGLVESNHGRANGATLGADGQALPNIIGLPLDGTGGRQRIVDTDAGQLDGDRVYDRAVGPMQFIPSTWQQDGADADNDGTRNPHDIDDAALAAGNYLCKGGRDLSVARDWWAAILAYNDVRQYAQAVFDAANRYGAASRT